MNRLSNVYLILKIDEWETTLVYALLDKPSEFTKKEEHRDCNNKDN